MSEPKIIVGKPTLIKTLVDEGTGVEIEFTHRQPTNAERLAYQREAIQSKGKKIVLKSAAAAREKVKPLITSFRFPNADPGTQLRVELAEGEVPLSCDTQDPGYMPAWRDVLARYVPQMLEVLGNKIFAGTSEPGDMVVFDYSEGAGEEEPEAAAGPR